MPIAVTEVALAGDLVCPLPFDRSLLRGGLNGLAPASSAISSLFWQVCAHEKGYRPKQ